MEGIKQSWWHRLASIGKFLFWLVLLYMVIQQSGTLPHLAGTLPLSRAVPPDPQGKPSLLYCPVLPSDPFASWATQPSRLSLPAGFTEPPTQLWDIRSAPDDKVGTPILSGGHSFGREGALSPGTP